MADRKFVCEFSGAPEDALVLCGRKSVGPIQMRGPGRPLPGGFIIPTESCTSHVEPGELTKGPTGEVMDYSGEGDTRSIRENPAVLDLAGYTMTPSGIVDQDLDEVQPPGGEA